MRPGATFKSTVQALRAPVNKAGLCYIECGFHAHGCTSGGFPSYNDSDDHIDDVENVIIHRNMVFTQQVDLYDPGVKRGSGVVLGDSFLVEEDRAVVLTNIPIELAIV
jgi:hypothetical protein